MPNPTVVFLVGHSNWGKSRTLKALTDGNSYQRRITIAGSDFFIRRMSNDDQPEGFIELMQSIAPEHEPYVLAALCPHFKDPAKGTRDVLQTLRNRGYLLYFWVMKHRFGKPDVITQAEIDQLRRFGTVEVVEQQIEADARAKQFNAYVRKVVPQ